MGKKDKKISRSGSNGSKKPDSISTIDRLNLQLIAQKRRALELQKQNVELQKQVQTLRVQIIDLQSKQVLEQLEKTEGDLVTSWESQLTHLKTGYGLNLEKDSVNTETGAITWNSEEEDVPEAAAATQEVEE